LGKALIQGHYEKWHQAQCCVPSFDNAMVLCDVLSSGTAPEPKTLPEVAPSFYVLPQPNLVMSCLWVMP
jgi:hypothetical protein